MQYFLLILGGGPIGVEMGQAFNRFGAEVTILQHDPAILPREDGDVSGYIQKRLQEEGLNIVTSTEINKVSKKEDRISTEGIRRLTGEGTEAVNFIGDALLLAAGRIPNIENLNLEAAGVYFGKRGIEVNEYLQTSQPHIYAVGDIVGSYQFTHTADMMARTVVRNILMPARLFRRKVNLSVVPWCTYTDPEVAHVGLSEEQAKREKIDYDLYKVPVAQVDRAIVESEEAGFAKVLTKKGSDRIMGATVVAAHGGDLLQEFVLALQHGVGLGKIGTTIHPYPTMASVAQKIADQYSRTRLTPVAETIFRWLYSRARK